MSSDLCYFHFRITIKNLLKSELNFSYNWTSDLWWDISRTFQLSLYFWLHKKQFSTKLYLFLFKKRLTAKWHIWCLRGRGGSKDIKPCIFCWAKKPCLLSLHLGYCQENVCSITNEMIMDVEVLQRESAVCLLSETGNKSMFGVDAESRLNTLGLRACSIRKTSSLSEIRVYFFSCKFFLMKETFF